MLQNHPSLYYIIVLRLGHGNPHFFSLSLSFFAGGSMKEGELVPDWVLPVRAPEEDSKAGEGGGLGSIILLLPVSVRVLRHWFSNLVVTVGFSFLFFFSFIYLFVSHPSTDLSVFPQRCQQQKASVCSSGLMYCSTKNSCSSWDTSTEVCVQLCRASYILPGSKNSTSSLCSLSIGVATYFSSN